MKKINRSFWGTPILIATLIAAFSIFFYWKTSTFEKAYVTDAQENIRQKTELVEQIVPALIKNKDNSLDKFCKKFNPNNLRITIIDSTGKVLVDSIEKSTDLANHLQRKEVIEVLNNNKPTTTIRYSETLNEKMIYFATPIFVDNQKYVLRTAISVDEIDQVLKSFRINLFWGILFGAQIVLLISLYIHYRIRKPLLRLVKNVDSISNGNLNTYISIPEKGVVREIALGVSKMTEELKQHIREIQNERSEKEQLFDTIGEGVLLFSADGVLLKSNIAANKILGFSNNEKFNLERCHIPDLLMISHKILKNGGDFENEFILENAQEKRYLFIKGIVIKNEIENRLLLTITELTKLHKLESFRSDFIANVSHEIKTPLTCILGVVEILEDDKDFPDAQRNLLEILKNQSRSLNNLLIDILNLARIEKQESTQEIQLFNEENLGEIIQQTITECQPYADKNNIQIGFQSEKDISLKIDSELIKEALSNLINNAIKYSESTKIDIVLKQKDNNAIINVTDYGIGIPEIHQARIFERFYRVDKSRSRELGGTGLGLAIVKHIVKLHKGQITLTSEAKKYTTFQITLPIK